jgi:hypothetical protein
VCAALVFVPQASGQAVTTVNTGIGHGQPLIPTEQTELPKTLSPVSIAWHYTEGMLTLHLVNNSGKDITAYSVSIGRKYADGTADMPGSSAIGAEFLSGFIYAQLPRGAEIQDATFAAGASRYEHIPDQKQITDVTAVADVLLFSDATAFVQNDRVFQGMMARRQAQLSAMQKVNEVLKRAMAEPDPPASALAALKPLLVDAISDQDTGAQMEYQNHLQNLQNAQRAKSAAAGADDLLPRYQEDLEKRIELMKPHCEIAVKQ